MTAPDDRIDRDAPSGAAAPVFPPEAGWLELEPPEFGDDFVGRTLAVLRDAGALPPAGKRSGDGDDADLPSELMATYRVPPPDGRFVERTLRSVRQARADQWRRLLLRYDAPAPTPDFVARTLAALRTVPPALRGRHTVLRSGARSWGPVLLAAAAAAVLLVWLRPARREFALRELVADTNTSLAPSRSPAVLSHLLLSLDDTAAGDTANTDTAALPVHAADGGWLWLAAAEAGR